MQAAYFESIRLALSNERLEAYRRASTETEVDMVARYAWNIALSESLYPTLQGLEVTLRNSLDRAAATLFHNTMWFDSNSLAVREHAAVQEAKAKLVKQRRPVQVGRIVAELDFGFWTSLFDKRYEQFLWPRLLTQTFPRMPRRMRTRQELSRRLNNYRRLRNRVFHHEPIWYLTDLPTQHRGMLDTIGWMNPAMRQLIEVDDHFDDVYQQGSTPFRVRIQSLIDAFQP